MDINYDVITLFQNTFILSRLRLANFTDIIKIATMFIKKIFELCIKMQFISVFLDIKKVAEFC